MKGKTISYFPNNYQQHTNNAYNAYNADNG
jgi:hypothetical protein